MQQDLPLLRYLLFVPANVEKYVSRAHEHGADAIILDLEDSVPLGLEDQARAVLVTAAQDIGRAN